MTYIPELSRETYLPVPDDGYEYVSVGWLGDTVHQPAPTDPEVVALLRQAARSHDARAIYEHRWVPAGGHSCEICGGGHGYGEFFVEHGRVRYLLPKGVFHYIEVHHYRLPLVVEAALRGEDTDEDIVVECAACGSAVRDAQFVRAGHDHEVYRCHCGHEAKTAVADSPRRFPAPARMRVHAAWAGTRPSGKELKALRQMYPEYRAQPPAKLRASLGSAPLHVGTYWRGQVAALVERGAAAGLSLRAREVPRFFPPGTIAKASHTSYEDWFGKHLEAMGEGALWSAGHRETVARFLWLRTFDSPVVVRVSLGHNPGLLAHRTSGQGGYEPGEIVESQRRALEGSEVQELRRVLLAADVPGMDARDSAAGADGSMWILELVESDRYHVVMRWSPGGGPLYDVCMALLRCSGLDTTPSS